MSKLIISKELLVHLMESELAEYHAFFVIRGIASKCDLTLLLNIVTSSEISESLNNQSDIFRPVFQFHSYKFFDIV